MSVSYIPEKVKVRLWGKAAGRCQYDGCNEPLWLDNLTNVEFNSAYIAHVIADRPNGPRGDKVLSEELKASICNLMLMCDKHHRLIDREKVAEHPVERLLEMKRKHESRIEMLTSITEDKQSHVLLYGANIGKHSAPLNWEKAAHAMLPDKYPAEKPAIELSIKNSSFRDNEELYWILERENLSRQFNDKVKSRISTGDIKNLSVFALAPQPLLVYLGKLISDIPSTEVFQLHREPPNWLWQEHPEEFEYTLTKPEITYGKVALKLSLSATLDNSRITKVLGEEVSIWELTIARPNNDFLKSQQQLLMFRKVFRDLLNTIKFHHGHDNELNIFLAVPVAIAIEIGRVWMPKADLPIILYDENRLNGGFSKTIVISNDE